jgi:hypothetical protein
MHNCETTKGEELFNLLWNCNVSSDIQCISFQESKKQCNDSMILSEMPDTNISHQKIFCCLVAWVGSSYWQHGDHNEQNHA